VSKLLTSSRGSTTRGDLEGPLLCCLKVSTQKPLRKRGKYLEVKVELPGGVGTKVGVDDEGGSGRTTLVLFKS